MNDLDAYEGRETMRTSAAPFEANTAYTPFAAYAVLEHRGDFTAAARTLRGQGYGLQAPTPDWRTRARRWTGALATIPAKEVPSWR